MVKISYAAFLCLSQLISGNSLLKCIAARNRQRIHKSKVIEFGGNREPVYDFLLVINSNLDPISHRY